MKCKYCNCPYNYYHNINHASRPSCLASPNNFHYFDSNINIFISKIFTLFNIINSKC